jgi:hypothetical protein
MKTKFKCLVNVAIFISSYLPFNSIQQQQLFQLLPLEFCFHKITYIILVTLYVGKKVEPITDLEISY